MKKKSNTILNIIKYAVTIVFAILFVAPLLLVFINSFKTKAEISSSALALPQTWNLDNYITIITESNFVSSFMTSIFTVVVTTSLTVLVAAITGYALARWHSKVSSIIMLVIMTTLFVPFQVYMVALIVVVRKIGLVGNLFGLILVYLALGMPVPIFLCRSYCVGLPRELEEAAIIDGCSRFIKCLVK